jgi:hypothetical protein
VCVCGHATRRGLSSHSLVAWLLQAVFSSELATRALCPLEGEAADKPQV